MIIGDARTARKRGEGEAGWRREVAEVEKETKASRFGVVCNWRLFSR